MAKETIIKSVDDLYAKYKNNVPKSDNGKEEAVVRLSTPFVSFDRWLGGGPAIGKISTYSGLYSSGKTSMALAIAGHNKDKMIGFLDQEYEWRDYSYDWVEKYFGIERDRIIVLQPRYLEEAGAMISDLCNTCDIIIQDGLTSIGTLGEYEDDMESYKMGADARILNKVLRKLRGKVYQTNTSLIITNKLYSVIGGYQGEMTEPGGGGPEYYPSQKLQLSKAKDKDSSGEVIGQKVNCLITKDKLTGNMYQKFTLYYKKQQGFDWMTDLILNATEFGIITKAGSWYSYGDTKIGQGINKVKQFIEDNANLEQELRSALKEQL